MSIIDPVWAGVAELSRAFGARSLSPVVVRWALWALTKTSSRRGDCPADTVVTRRIARGLCLGVTGRA